MAGQGACQGFHPWLLPLATETSVALGETLPRSHITSPPTRQEALPAALLAAPLQTLSAGGREQLC